MMMLYLVLSLHICLLHSQTVSLCVSVSILSVCSEGPVCSASLYTHQYFREALTHSSPETSLERNLPSLPPSLQYVLITFCGKSEVWRSHAANGEVRQIMKAGLCIRKQVDTCCSTGELQPLAAHQSDHTALPNLLSNILVKTFFKDVLILLVVEYLKKYIRLHSMISKHKDHITHWTVCHRPAPLFTLFTLSTVGTHRSKLTACENITAQNQLQVKGSERKGLCITTWSITTRMPRKIHPI